MAKMQQNGDLPVGACIKRESRHIFFPDFNIETKIKILNKNI